MRDQVKNIAIIFFGVTAFYALISIPFVYQNVVHISPFLFTVLTGPGFFLGYLYSGSDEFGVRFSVHPLDWLITHSIFYGVSIILGTIVVYLLYLMVKWIRKTI